MKEVTIIVPIYHVEKYLRACFDSLLKQEGDAYEILAVSDGSHDGCEDIMKEYEEKHRDLIHCVYKENGGYGSVLQLAIKTIRTPYFLVCDPDDTLESNAVETLLSLAKMSGADLTIGAKTFVYENSEERDYDPAYNRDFVTLKPDTVYRRTDEAFNDLFFVDPSPHAKLYKRTFSRFIQFPEKVGYTDNLLFYMNLLQAENVIYTDRSLANYLIDRAGNSMGDVSKKAMNGEIDVFCSIIEQAKNLKRVPDMFWYRMFASFKFMLYKTRRMDCDESDYESTLDHLEAFLRELLSYGEAIRPYYRRFTTAKIKERAIDELLLRPSAERRAYQHLRQKMTREFRKNG